jgi:hydrogenase maturation protease
MVTKPNLTSNTRNILLAIGNRYRLDDGVAWRVLELLGSLPDVEVRQTLQLMPEMAVDFAAAGCVVFVDADVQPGEARLERITSAGAGRAAMGHAVAPAELVAIAEKLFGFSGEAWLCRVPGEEFSDGVGLTARAEQSAQAAAKLLLRFFA